MIGGSQKLPEVLLVQKNPQCKFKLGGDKCGGKFNKFNIFVKASTSSSCIGESRKQRAKLK